MENLERLQKVIAAAGVTSRRKAEALITTGVVKVNGKTVKELGTKVSSKDKIEVNGVPIHKESHVYLLMNKPRGCVTTVKDEFDRQTVMDLIGTKVAARVYPVGRLDYDTAGVLLLTNDGDFANKMMHPRTHIPKTYLARVKGIATKSTLKPLLKGVKIDGHVTAPAVFQVLSVDKENQSTLVELIIHEGRYHQVKNMLEAVGHPVKRLRRDRFAFLDVNGVAQGKFRHLTKSEVKALLRLADEEASEKMPIRATKGMRQY
ncbi:MAG: rRNA pseudouridine synthase [Defluviitaleaceae bacterium]|nr:rRNA pseudouridine synthase [Defluviitaleaceae bacterium]